MCEVCPNGNDGARFHCEGEGIVPGFRLLVFGPSPLISILQDSGAIELVPKGWGEVVVSKCGPTGVLSADEIQLINKVAEFVNTFENATDISSFSHGLDAWRNTASGQPIGYAANAEQVADAIERRMGR